MRVEGDKQITRRLSEEELFSGYGTTVRAAVAVSGERSERCACGGVIRVALATRNQITVAVRAHQATLQHQAWWAQVYW